ncbi:hypothetical protein [Paenibacillus odorifer]|nr:hypothetical protein [Paenibacillus odorifer]
MKLLTKPIKRKRYRNTAVRGTAATLTFSRPVINVIVSIARSPDGSGSG